MGASFKSYNEVSFALGLSKVTKVTSYSLLKALAMTADTRCTPPMLKMLSVKKQILFFISVHCL
jgi:hypothetical protein